MTMSRGDCVALITAAGESSRMGRPKALLRWQGTTLLAHQCSVLDGFRDVVVVLGSEAEPIASAVALPPPARIVVNPRWREGRSTSLEAGMAALGDDWAACLVAAVDQPLDRAIVDRLLHFFDPVRFACAVPAWRGQRGHPLLLSDLLAPAVADASQYEDGLRGIVRARDADTLVVPFDTPAVHLDLNTMADYEDALEE